MSGFQTLSDPIPELVLEVQGNLPLWLSGTLLRTGPAKFDLGKQTVNHWFDGLSLLQRFSFHNGRITYAADFLRSEAYNKAAQEKRLRSNEFGTNPPLSLLERLMAVLTLPKTDNGNVNIARLNDHYLSLTETPFPVEFNPQTLSTVSAFTFADNLKGQITTAHPQYDLVDGSAYNLLTNVSTTSHYQFYHLRPGSQKRHLIASLPVAQPGYIHSFALTQSYIVLFEFPLLLNPLELLFSGKPYIENYHWHKNKTTRIFVIDKTNGTLVFSSQSDPCFAFHHANAYEENGSIVVDLIAYEDPAIIQAFYLNKVGSANIPQARLRRYTISPTNKKIVWQFKTDSSLEMPALNSACYAGRKYRYLYGAAPHFQGDFFSSLIKLDLQNENELSWSEKDIYTGEPTFIQAPNTSIADTLNNEIEDQGVILTLCLDTKKSKSVLIMIDAQSMQEIGRAYLPVTIPFALHGQFFPHQ
ncbi:MAG: carotenoid oxygenase family protein [Candidatus Obscuribacterales bacterium]|nr:carotenoid oxygenase family protein [Candidatus Obscuribacterales bacterium]